MPLVTLPRAVRDALLPAEDDGEPAPEASYADLVEACVRRWGVEAAHLSAVTPDGQLRPMAASDDVALVLALLQRHLHEGPAVDALRDGVAVAARDADEVRRRWPRLAPELDERGISSAYALPLRDPCRPDEPVTSVLVVFADRPLDVPWLPRQRTRDTHQNREQP